MYFGTPGNIQEIPYPKTGMGMDSTVDTEVTSLVSGGRSVYRAPTAFQRRVMNWAANSTKLAHLIDMYNGQFGPGPFYFSDPYASEYNVLTPRWSNSWQLAHQTNGWCRPVIDTDDGLPTTPNGFTPFTDRYVKLTQATAGASVKLEGVLRTRLIRVPGKAYYLAVFGSATGGGAIKVRGFSNVTNAWVNLTTYTTLDGKPREVVGTVSTDITMIELDVYMPLGSTLNLKGMALSTVDYTGIIGAVRTNLLTNPAPASTTGFAVSGGTGAWTYNTGEADPFARFTKDATVATTSFYWGTAITAPIGTVVSERFWVRSSNAATITLRNNATQFSPNETRALAANTWTEVTLQGTVTTIADFRLGFFITNMAAGTLDLKKGIVEFASTSPNYFTGSTSGAGYQYAWTGTANASTSTQTVYPAPSNAWMPRGTGIGPVQFDGDAGRELVSTVIDRIGLSLSVTEVQSVESRML